MQEPHRNGVANHPDLESCVGGCEAAGEALTEARAGWVWSRERTRFGRRRNALMRKATQTPSQVCVGSGAVGGPHARPELESDRLAELVCSNSLKSEGTEPTPGPSQFRPAEFAQSLRAESPVARKGPRVRSPPGREGGLWARRESRRESAGQPCSAALGCFGRP